MSISSHPCYTKPMKELHEYLKKHKFFLEILAILTALTALIIAIPETSTQPEATAYLVMTKFSVLLLLSLCTGFGLVKLALFFNKIYNNQVHAQKETYQIAPHLTILLLVSLIPFGLWGYLISAYRTHLNHMLIVLLYTALIFGTPAAADGLKRLGSYMGIQQPLGHRLATMFYIFISYFGFAGLLNHVTTIIPDNASISLILIYLAIITNILFLLRMLVLHFTRAHKH